MAQRQRQLLVLLAGMLLVAAALAATHPLGTVATSGVPHLPQRPQRASTADPTGQPMPTAQPSTWTPPDLAPANPALTRALGVIALLAALAAVFWVVRVLSRTVRLERELVSDAESSPRGPQVDLDDMADELQRAHERILASDDFGGAVVEAWRRLEDLAARSGTVREPWQSTTEYSVEVLQHTPVDRDDLEQLAEVYRSAVYSSTPPGPADRERALACLARLRDALEAS